MKHFKGFIALLTAAILFISTGFISGSAWGRQVAEAYPGAMSAQNTAGDSSPSPTASHTDMQADPMEPNADGTSGTGTTSDPSNTSSESPEPSVKPVPGDDGASKSTAGDSAQPRASQASGTVGDNCQWRLEDGVLHIGTAEGQVIYTPQSDIDSQQSPWHQWANDITSISIDHKIQAKGKLSYLFFNLHNAKSITAKQGWWNWWDVSEVENICNNDASLEDISAFSEVDTRNIRSFKYAFKHCEKLANLKPLTNWRLNGLKGNDGDWWWGDGLEGMFAECYSLTDLTPLNQHQLQDGEWAWNMWFAKRMPYMFQRCTSLVDLTPLANWNMQNAVDLTEMFRGCHKLANLQALANWNTGNVENMSQMFSMERAKTQGGDVIDEREPKGGAITDLAPLGKWNVGKVQNMNSMFRECTELADLSPLKDWNTGQVSTMNSMFFEDGRIHDVSALGNWSMNRVNNISTMFSNVNTVEPTSQMSFAPLERWSFDGLNSYDNVFEGVLNITQIGVPQAGKGSRELMRAYLNASSSADWKTGNQWIRKDNQPSNTNGPFTLTRLDELINNEPNVYAKAVYVRYGQDTGDLGLSVKQLIYRNEGTGNVPNGGNRSFGFTVALRDGDGNPVEGTFAVEEFRNNTPNNITTYQLEFNANGEATVHVRSYETDMIMGLPAGAKYEITPLKPPAGYGLTETMPSLTGTIPVKNRQTVSFTYTYFAQHAQVTVNLKKQLKGYTNSRPALQAGEFEFPYILCEVQRDNSCKQMQNGTATNAADGIIGLPTFEFAKRGTYRLEVRETKGSDRGIGYDTTTSTTTIEVSDDRNGHLTSTVNTDYGTFTNTVYKPAGLPETGREAHLGLIVAVAAAALFALVVALLPSKRRE